MLVPTFTSARSFSHRGLGPSTNVATSQNSSAVSGSTERSGSYSDFGSLSSYGSAPSLPNRTTPFDFAAQDLNSLMEFAANRVNGVVIVPPCVFGCLCDSFSLSSLHFRSPASIVLLNIWAIKTGKPQGRASLVSSSCEQVTTVLPSFQSMMNASLL